jgi:hypothetical protein
MASQELNFQIIENLIKELVEGQNRKLLECGRRFVPNLTPEDMLQPNDYNELELNPHFRYEEGILHGILSIQMAIRASNDQKRE